MQSRLPAGALNGLGWIASGQNKTDEAIRHWKKAVAAAPGATAALDGLTTTCMAMHRYDKAAEYYRLWLKAEPTSVEANKGLEEAAKAGAAVTSAVAVAQSWLGTVDAADYARSWQQAAAAFKTAATQAQWEASLKTARTPLGKVLSRKALTAMYATSLPGAADGQYLVIQFETSFENKKDAVETVTPMKDADGKWRVSGYYIKWQGSCMGGTGRFRTTAGAGRGTWPALVFVVAGVLVPTVCVLWFMRQAVGNERLAVRQRLRTVYQGQLDQAVTQTEVWLTGKLNGLAGVDADTGPAAAFAQIARAGRFDSVVICDDTGEVIYPSTTVPAPTGNMDEPAWQTAERLEFQAGDWPAALQAYRQIADGSDDPHVQARALLAQARCLGRLDQTDAAVAILLDALAAARHEAALDRHGRLLRPNALLLAAHMLDNEQSPLRATAIVQLTARLNDYAPGTMPSGQRRFLMRQVSRITGGQDMFPTLAPEELAWGYVSAGAGLTPAADGLSATALDGLWQLADAEGKRVGLLRQQRIVAEVEALVGEHVSLDGAAVRLVPPTGAADEAEPFLSASAGQSLAGWQLALHLAGPDPFAAAADRQIALYWWTGTLSIGAIAALAAVAGQLVQRQMRLARLKNDLIATVSHELKTPLASIRVLVDTLLAGRCPNEEQAGEYLELIAAENERLSRLIDNFLAFSRMERNKHAFEHELLDVAVIVDAAAASVRERFSNGLCRFDVDVAEGLRPVRGDREALVTVLLNLLDNAYKYTGEDKRITLRAFADHTNVCFEVADNGIGIPARAQRRVFDRFYQVDQRLARDAGGCGLGLSIVKFIVEAHNGAVAARSEVGKGSVFSVTLPAA